MDVGENEDFKPHMILGDVKSALLRTMDEEVANRLQPNSNHQERNMVRVHAPLVREANRIMPLLWEDEDWYTPKDLHHTCVAIAHGHPTLSA